MQTEQFLDEMTEKATGLMGDAAGMVADPKAGMAKLRSGARPAPMLMMVAVATVAYLVGRRAGRRAR